jgi:hypothetical protein
MQMFSYVILMINPTRLLLCFSWTEESTSSCRNLKLFSALYDLKGTSAFRRIIVKKLIRASYEEIPVVSKVF